MIVNSLQFTYFLYIHFPSNQTDPISLCTLAAYVTMAVLFSSTPTLTYNNGFVAKPSLPAATCPNLISPFMVLHPSSAFAGRKWRLFELSAFRFVQGDLPLVGLVARSYIGDRSRKSSDEEEDDYNDGGAGGEEDEDDTIVDWDDSIKIEIEKTGKNQRRIRSKVAVRASFQTVWNILTDYERLADFIPGLAVSRLLEKRENFARLYQIGEQNLALGLKFNAKGTIDCYEKELQTLPSGNKRDIDFTMIEGDFKRFEGKWSVEEGVQCNAGNKQSDDVGQEYQTTLVYIVDVEPKLWLPVRLVEGRLCKEIRTNLSCIRAEAERLSCNAVSAY